MKSKIHAIGLTFTILALTCAAFAALLGAQTNDAAWRITITNANEPGEPMLVSGTIYAADGKTPLAGAEVYVYHTDNEGYYSKGSNNSRNPRLKGTMSTNAEGKYEYRTIKPAPYPGGSVPAHVHYVIKPKGREKVLAELQFEGDRWLGDKGRLSEAQRRDTFAEVRPLAKDAHGVWQVVKDFKIE